MQFVKIVNCPKAEFMFSPVPQSQESGVWQPAVCRNDKKPFVGGNLKFKAIILSR